jgi:hypothetical protein
MGSVLLYWLILYTKGKTSSLIPDLYSHQDSYRQQQTLSQLFPSECSTIKHEWRRRMLNFAPSWFSVNMGTGITSIVLFNLIYQHLLQ